MGVFYLRRGSCWGDFWGYSLGFFKFGAVFVWDGFDGLFLVWGTNREMVVFVLFQFFFLIITPITLFFLLGFGGLLLYFSIGVHPF